MEPNIRLHITIWSSRGSRVQMKRNLALGMDEEPGRSERNPSEVNTIKENTR